MNEAQLTAIKNLALISVLSTMLISGALIVVLHYIGKIVSKLDLIIRKLNNSQPDDEGGY